MGIRALSDALTTERMLPSSDGARLGNGTRARGAGEWERGELDLVGFCWAIQWTECTKGQGQPQLFVATGLSELGN